MPVPINTLLCVSALVALTTWATPGKAHAQDEPVLIVADVSVVDVPAGSVLDDRYVTIADGRIVEVTATPPSVPGAVTVDGDGLYLMPGLWDMHAHLRSPIAPTIIMPQFIAHGVTGVREMASECDRENSSCLSTMLEWQADIDAGELLGPRLLALSSFPVNPPWDYDMDEEEARDFVRDMANRGVDFIKVYFRLSPTALAWITDEAGRLGIGVGGHLPLTMTTREASEVGLRSLEHARDFLFDCFPGSADFRSTARSQNPPMDVMRSMVDDHEAATCSETFEVMAQNDTWYVPTHVTRRMDAYADDPSFREDSRARYLPDVVWDSWQEDADRMVALDPSPEGRATVRGFYEKGLEITGRAHAAGVPIVMGTDAGDTYVFFGSGAHDELGELVKAGLTPAEALASATSRSAEFLGLEEMYGTVEAGKVADLILLRANPLQDIEAVRQIEAVIFDGRLHDRSALDRMLEETAEAAAAFEPN